MKNIIISIIGNTVLSSLIFLFLIFKSKIRKRFIYTDNIIIIAFSVILGNCIFNLLSVNNIIFIIFANIFITVVLAGCLILFRFYRDPERHHSASPGDILSPGDGFVVYIKRIEKNGVPFSVKDKTVSNLKELSKVNILQSPCWLVGIVMTVLDVHVNRAPISGKVVLNKHFKGKFISLKRGEADIENERNTMVIKNERCQIGVIQIASKRVRGIETYIKMGQDVEKGQRIGRINFGSQTDIIFPVNAKIKVKIGQWVYGGKTIIATLNF